MLQQKSVAVDYCLNRATECEKLADLPSEHREKVVYRKLARTWMNLDAAMQRSARLIERFRELRVEIEIGLMEQKLHLADRKRLRWRVDALRRQVP
jgi:hypothetical protein